MYKIYLRVSTLQQAESRHGLNSQRDACVARCKDSPYKVYSDEGISGGTHIVERPGLMELLREFEKGDILLVAQRDRMGRDPIVVAVLEKTIEERGGYVASVAGEGTGSSSPSDILIKRVVDAISEYVRLNGRLRVKMALAAKKKRRERTGSVPYGYRLAEDGIHLVEDEKEQATIQAAQVLYGTGIRSNISYGKISEELTRHGHVSRNGKPFLAEQIKRMVKE
jgi:site-specific DNA recombinase